MNAIGVSCPDFGKEDFGQCLEKISGHFRHWEIFSEMNHSVQRISGSFHGIADSLGMTFSVHSAIADTNAAALNPRMREASAMEFMSEMEAASEMGAQTITVHPGLINLALSDVRKRSIAAAQETMRVLDRAQAEYGVKVAVENMPDFFAMLGRTASELEEIVDSTDLGICFDIGHANTMGQIDAMIETFGDRIANVHIHDNMGVKDDHMTIGTGTIDFRSIIPKLRFYKGNYIIESKTLESAVESQEVLKKILSE